MNRTKAFLLVLLVVALAWEGFALAGAFGPNATISEAVWNLEAGRPLVSFGIGLLCGHFVWQRKG